MEIKTFETKFSDLSLHYYFRFDEKYFFTIRNLFTKKYIKVKNIFDIVNGIYVDTDLYTKNKTKKPFIRIGALSSKYDIEEKKVIYLGEDVQIPQAKMLKREDLILATIGATIGKIDLANDFEGGTFSNNTTVLRIKEKYRQDFNLKFLEKLFQSDLLHKYVFGVASQKAHPNLQTYDLANIKIPLISKSVQDQAVAKIKPIENRIRKLKRQFKDPVEILNEVFAKEFEFDLEKFGKLKKKKHFKISLSKFSNNKDLRCSFNFHNKAGKFVLESLQSKRHKKIKEFLAEPIILGAGISPEFYDENGDYYYISMADIKTWYFDEENTRKVSNQYAEKKRTKRIQKNDIILARSGKGTIGKVALINKEIKGILCDFTMRVRLKRYNELFAYYYFRTDFFQYLIETNKKGLGNNTNIFPSQIQEFPLLDIPLSTQQKIVNKIKTELDEQETMRKETQKEREKIDEIINECIK